MVPATRSAVLDLDGVVLRHQTELLEERQVAVAEVVEVVAWVGSWHEATVARRSQRKVFAVERRPAIPSGDTRFDARRLKGFKEGP